MACYHPKRVAMDDDGRLDWSIARPTETSENVVLVPCRQCIGCRAGSAREWAIRCYHESLGHTRKWQDPDTGVGAEVPNNVMLTLTYSDENLPDGGLLRLSDVQAFFKRLRKRRATKVTYFVAGEYGGRTARPHYHAILFGEDFSDRYHIRTSDQQVLNCSFELDALWRLGRATLDDVNFQSIRYVTGYLLKKTNGDGKFTGPLIETSSKQTGELRIEALAPEFRVMSRRPGLGREWFKRNYKSVYPSSEIMIEGHSFPPPGQYDRWLKKTDVALYRETQTRRFDSRIQSQIDWTPSRCASAEEIHSQRLRQDAL